MIRAGLVDLTPLRRSVPFRRLWIGGSISAFGTQMAIVAVLYQVWQLTGSPVWTGMVGLVSALGMVCGSLLGGTMADSRDRSLILRWTTLGQLLAVLGLAGQAAAAMDSVAPVLVLVGLNSFCSGMGAASRRSLPARLLDLKLLPAGIALNHLGVQVAMLFGPALGGLVTGSLGLTVCYSLCFGSLCLALYTVLRLPRVPPAQSVQPRSTLSMAWEGVRYVSRPGPVRGAFGTDLFATLLVMPVALFPMINEYRLDGAPETLGMMTSSVAVGGFFAGLCSGAVIRTQRLGVVQSWAAGIWCVALAGFGLSHTLWLILGTLAIAGAADTVSVIARGALVQLVTPDSHRGRVSAAEHVITAAGPDLGNARGGLVAGLIGAPAAMAGGGALALVGVVWIAVRNEQLRHFRQRDARQA